MYEGWNLIILKVFSNLTNSMIKTDTHQEGHFVVAIL